MKESFCNYNDFKKRRAELESKKGYIVKSYCWILENIYRLSFKAMGD